MRKSILSKCSIVLITLLIILSCNDTNKRKIGNRSNALIHSIEKTETKNSYNLKDLIWFSKNKYGFQNNDGTINEFYGDFDIVSVEKSLFEFNVGCGRCGDIISVFIYKNPSKNNFFNLYIPKGDKYYGKLASSNKKIGELEIVSENEIHGYIKLCLEVDFGCCGEVGEKFLIKKVNKNNSISSKNEKRFNIIKHKDLPSWFEKTDRTYMLNDDRIIENKLVEYVGGHLPNKGDIFFIDNTEVIFPENNINIKKEKSLITKILKSGKYTIKIIWDTSLTTGAYSEGTINLYYENEAVFNSSLVISGW